MKICGKCGKIVRGRKIAWANKKPWHRTCFELKFPKKARLTRFYPNPNFFERLRFISNKYSENDRH